MGRTKHTLRNNNTRPSSPPRKMFPYPGARAEALMGNEVRLVEGEVCDCVAYHDVIHPVVIRRILDNGKVECEVPAFDGDKEWFVDIFDLQHLYKPRDSEPVLFVKHQAIEFKYKNRSDADNGEEVWVRGWMLDEKQDRFIILHFDWDTRGYTSVKSVHKSICRTCPSIPGKY